MKKNPAQKIILTLFTIYYLLSSPLSVYAATFTAGMAARNAPGPFTAAPIVQGGWGNDETGDVLNFFYKRISSFR
jgi:hypothetical protein